MTPLVYDFMHQLSKKVDAKGVVGLHRVYINFTESCFNLLYYSSRTGLVVPVIDSYGFSCDDSNLFKFEIAAYLPIILSEDWILWDGYFSTLYENFKRVKTIDTLLLEL